MALARLNSGTVADKIRAMIESAAKGYMMDVLITPDIAKMLMRYNAPGLGGTNRKLRKMEVDHWASIIADGQWVNTGEPIIMSDDKTLNDGQHRLAAVIASGQAALMDIRFGIPRDAFMTTNVGRMRTAVDVLTIVGTTEQARAGAMLRMIICYKKGLPGALFKRVRTAEIAAASQAYPEVTDALQLLQGAGRRINNATVGTLLFFALRTASATTVESFLGILKSDTGSAGGPTAAHQLALAIWTGQGFSNDTAGRAEALAVGIQCWNAYRLNETLRASDRWRLGMAYPTVDRLTL